ncbi:MAG: permease-like cell division protein FtsX [Tissierellia bacterium]|nr:permease-like cell division protein FtsX [Tissierellia bacterium]
MNLRILTNIFKQGFQGLSRNRSMSFVSVLSISIVLIILGIVLVLVLSINKVAVDTNKTIDQIDVYLDLDLSVEDIKSLGKEIEAIGGIKSIHFKSKDQGLKEMKASFGEDAYILDGYDEHNPLPNMFIVRVYDISNSRIVEEKIRGMKGVMETQFFATEIEQMLAISSYIKIGGLAMVIFLTFISIFLISNTIKLAVNSRRAEISIMKWVGATNGYIKGPFFIEGIVLGLIAAFVASALMYGGYYYFYTVASANLSEFLRSAFVAPQSLYLDMTIIFLTLGVGIGALGSLISLKKFLKV